MQRSFTDAINGLLAIPRAERTRADQLRYLVLTRAVIFIDIYHNLLNDGPYKIVELLLNAIADVLELCSAGFEVAAQAASEVLCAISHFFAAFGVTLQDPSQPWVPVVAGALAGLGTAGVVIGSGAAVPGPGWVVAATTAFGAAIAYGLSRYFAPPMVVAHVAVEPLDSTEGPLTTLPPPAPELPV